MLAVSNTPCLDSNLNDGLTPVLNHPNGVHAKVDATRAVVHSLMCYRQDGEPKEFALRAIESLIKKLKEKHDDLDALVTAITTSGNHPSKCVTIQRTLDGRMQIAGRKCLPHLIYARIWRWPDLHRNELRHARFCTNAFELKQDAVCINPYHYERVVSPAEFGSLTLSPLKRTDSVDVTDSDSDHPDLPTSGLVDHNSRLDSCSDRALSLQDSSDLLTLSTNEHSSIHSSRLTVQALLDEPDSPIAPTNDSSSSSPHKSLASIDDGVGTTSSLSSWHSSLYRNALHASTDRVNPMPHVDRGQSTMAWSGVAIVPNQVGQPVNEATSASDAPKLHRPSSLDDNSFTVNSYSDSLFCMNVTGSSKFETNGPSNPCPMEVAGNGATGVSGCSNKDGGGSGNAGDGGGSSGGGGGSVGNSTRETSGSNFGSGAGGGAGSGGWGQRGGRPPQPPFTPSGSLLQPVPVLTTQRPPEFWCNIAYFELDQQVGELFKVPSQYSRVTVDGYTDPSSPNRFCLGQLSNVHRSEQSEKSRLYIGKGVELDNVGEGDVWIRCLSEFSVFVQSYYLDREAGRRPGDAVHKIYPGAYIKVFDIRQCHEQMKLLAHSAQLAAEHQAAVVVGSIPSPTANAPQISPLMSQLPPGPSQTNTMQANQGGAGGAAGTAGGLSPLATADVGVDDLRRLCMLRLSFVKGWGPDYPRRSIKETPCWIEIQLHRPLQLLDEVLQGMPLNDRKPTRHFFPYFSQPSSCPAPRLPSAQSAPRRA